MGKKRQRRSVLKKGVCIAEDRISQLPDEILVYILSSLTVEEASYTSILSRRWRSLWTCIDRLDFDATEPLDEVASKYKLRKKYLRWVNSTLQMCKEQTLSQFRICFDLDKYAQYDIDKWLEFAFSRKVQRLELDLRIEEDYPRDFNNCYAFPARLLGLGDSAHSSSSKPHSDKLQIHPLVQQNFKSLKMLLLKSVNVTGQVLEFFLHNCPFIETMVVHESGTLVNLEVVGPSLKLRHLEIWYCRNVESLKICDTNLVTLGTSSGRLEVLTLDACFSLEELEHYNFPILAKLKKFVFITFRCTLRWKGQSLLGCTSIIRAAPQLKEFEIQVTSSLLTEKRKCKKGIRWPLPHLKVVKLWGIYSGVLNLELVRYFLENAVALEKVIIDPTEPIFCPHPLTPENIKVLQTSRNRAKLQLEREVPQAIELVIL
ncbi:putative F-box protein At1g49610 [Solanum pennellii]|uniref:F-box protein At1g49610 n=1 Tax=Solanum pennellii TaxID=28526 RepID=A0ABM1GLA6_SOLPN|nr:putative F-box protein At1g49610 [Solanum pennellii]